MKTVFLNRYPLGNEKRSWRQDNFILSVSHPGTIVSGQKVIKAMVKEGKTLDDIENKDEIELTMRRSVKTAKECGFNLLSLCWADYIQSRTAVEMCDDIGVDILYQNITEWGGMQTAVSVECTDDKLREAAEIAKNHRHILGYFSWDEPVGEEERKTARYQMDFVEKLTPDKLVYTVAVPSYNKYYTWENGKYPEYIRDFVKDLEPSILDFDYYPFYSYKMCESKLDDCTLWCDLGCVSKCANEHGIPFWYYYQGEDFHRIGHFSFPMIRFSAYSGVLYGAKGLSSYRESTAVIAEDGGKGMYFDEQKKLLSELANLGSTLMALNFKRVIHDSAVLSIPYIKGLACSIEESEHLTGAMPNRICASEFEDGYGNKYLFVLNRNYTWDQKFSLQFKKNYRVYEVSKQDGFQKLFKDSADTLELTLEAGDAMLFRLQDSSEEAYLIDYVLKK